MPATAASAGVAQAGSLPYRGLVIREARAGGEALGWTGAPPTASRRHGRLTICATVLGRALPLTVGARSIALRPERGALLRRLA
jgi:hypothetical protein